MLNYIARSIVRSAETRGGVSLSGSRENLLPRAIVEVEVALRLRGTGSQLYTHVNEEGNGSELVRLPPHHSPSSDNDRGIGKYQR